MRESVFLCRVHFCVGLGTPFGNEERVVAEAFGARSALGDVPLDDPFEEVILDGEEHLFEGVVEGRIIDREAGHEGFGYDPLFIPDGYAKTFAEMTTDEKNAVSHRARAVRKLAEFLRSIEK